MADLRYKKEKKLNRPFFSSFVVERDASQGYRVKLNWNYSNEKTVGFRLYRATISRNLLDRKYVISQRALEVLTPGKSSRWKNNILYNKNFFVQNSNVSFENEESSRHIEEERNQPLQYEYMGFMRSNSSGDYHYLDHSVKFGKSYSYIITAITSTMNETERGAGFIVSIQDLTPPECSHKLKASEVANGILLNFDFSSCHDAERYIVYRRRVGDIKWEFVEEEINTKSEVSFMDGDVSPGNEYEYKTYLKDMYGNISFSSPVSRIEYRSNFLKKGAIIDPIVKISYEDPGIRIFGQKNSDKIIGYRIERMDVSDREMAFEIKKDKSERPWPSVFLFDDDENIELIDFNIEPGKIYKYRISSISLFGKIESLYITPPFLAAEAVFDRTLLEGKNLSPVTIANFDVEILNSKQVPVYAKLTWDIKGDWEYIKVFYNDKNIIVDNIHNSIFIDSLEGGGSYSMFIEAYNLLDEPVAKSRPVRVRV